MPIKDGFDVLTFIIENEEFSHIPVIMMSADKEVKNIAACLRKGAKNYLVKPIRPHFLREILKLNIQTIEKDIYNLDTDLD